MTEQEIARINELYHKSKAEGLTEDEKLSRRTFASAILNPSGKLKGKFKERPHSGAGRHSD